MVEDGVLVEMLNWIGVTNRYFVEFGIQDGTEGNCVLLADVLGWSGLFLEADEADFARMEAKHAGTRVATLREYVTGGANQRDPQWTRPFPPNLMFCPLTSTATIFMWGRPRGLFARVVIVEYNSGIEPGEPRVQPHDPAREWDGPGHSAPTLAALDVVAERKGYRLAHSDSAGVNAFYVRADLWEDLGIDRGRAAPRTMALLGSASAPADPPGGWVEVC